jgi:prophage antirepressor-like protein
MNNTIEETYKTEDNVVYYNLNYIAKYVIESTNPREYVKKITTKIKHDNYFKISEDNLIKLLTNIINKSKTKSIEYLQLIKNKQVVNGIVKNIEVESNYIDISKSVFNFEGFHVNYLLINDDYYFKAKEVALVLKYKNTFDAIYCNVDNDCIFILEKLLQNDFTKAVDFGEYLGETTSTHNTVEILKKEINLQMNTLYINEAGLYSLILRSNKQEAKVFRKWVTVELLPSLRKTGAYTMKQFNLSDYKNKNCIYIFNVQKNIYKYGMTQDIHQRCIDHKSSNLLFDKHKQIRHLEIFDTYNELMEIEKIIGCFIKETNIQRNYNDGVEFFKGTEKDIYDILKMMSDYKKRLCAKNVTEYHNAKADKSIQLLVLINQQIDKTNRTKEIKLEKDLKTKKLEFENNNDVKRLELEKDIETKRLELRKDKHIELKKLEIQLKMKELETKVELEKEKTKQICNSIPKPSVNKKKKTKHVVQKPVIQAPNPIIQAPNPAIQAPNPVNRKCKDCNIPVYKTSMRCNDCNSKFIFESHKGRPTLSQLKIDLIVMKSFVQVGKKYDVSDNCIRKWIKKYEKYS